MNLDKLENQARALIDQDQRIEAIKLVRQTTGWGLRESKEYVDTLARAALPALNPADEAALEQAVKALIQQDRYAEAVKHVREQTGWGLGDCKAYVDALAGGSTVNWVFVASRVSDLLDRGMKDEAVEWLMAQGGMTAREARDYVDSILTVRSSYSSPGSRELPAQVVSQVRDLLASDRKVEAVKLVCILTNWGLRDSKDYVDSLESKKKRRRKRRRRRKARRGDAGFKTGDSVVVKPGTVDPDFGIEIGGWQGRVVEAPGDKDMVLIRWDSITLRNMPDSIVEQCEEQGLSWTEMILSGQEVELASPRDTEADVARVVSELSEKHAWSWLGEEGVRIGRILAGVDPDDEMAVLDAWEDYLAKHLSFPFEAEVSEYQERGPLQAGDRVTVQGIFDVDDLYGIIVRLRHGRKRYTFPLCDLEVTDEYSPNHQIVKDYAVWFANR